MPPTPPPVLGEQGLSRVESAANFLPQTLGTLLALLAVGALADRGYVRSVLVISMALFGLSMFSLQYVTPGLPAIAYGFLTGASRAGPKALAAATFPRLFGLTHLGAIRGFEKGIGNAASAFGPLGFSLLRNIAGSYSHALRFSLVLPLAVILLAVFVRRIDPDPPAPQ